MLDFLLKNKKIILYLLVLTALAWQNYRIKIYQDESGLLAAKLNTCTLENAQWKAANQEAQAQYKQRLMREALREKEAAKAQAESAKRMDKILHTQVKGGCQGAIDYGITQAQALNFHWNNDIP